jgi:hypothetical protein
MVINHKYNFLFIHIHKTAGSSVADALLKLEDSEFFAHHHTHLSWIDYQKYKDYYKFCFVRNPWDRLVSWYFGILKLKANNDFQKYIKLCCSNFSEFLNCDKIIKEKVNSKYEVSSKGKTIYFKSIAYNQLDYISHNDKVLVDFVGRFENLNDDWEFILKKLSIKNLKLSFKNKGFHQNYKNYYEKKDIDKVASLYKRDIDYFNYEF